MRTTRLCSQAGRRTSQGAKAYYTAFPWRVFANVVRARPIVQKFARYELSHVKHRCRDGNIPRMKPVLVIALYLVATTAQAQVGQAIWQSERVTPAEQRAEQTQSRQAAKPSQTAEARKYPAASLAVLLVDDADAITLPPFASRTTPAPTRVLRVGVQLSY